MTARGRECARGKRSECTRVESVNRRVTSSGGSGSESGSGSGTGPGSGTESDSESGPEPDSDQNQNLSLIQARLQVMASRAVQSL